MKKRTFDLLLAFITLVILLLPCLCIALVIRTTSTEKAIYWSERVGQNKVNFMMPKFTTMRKGTPSIATHLLDHPEKYYIPIGSFLRKTSLDEIPQLWSILIGKMTFVGPRPALFNQYDLVELREKHNINELKPGLTGWAQINGRDDLSISQKVELDLEYKLKQSFILDIKIITLTFKKIFDRRSISH